VDAAVLEGDVVAWRRHLHQRPELSFREYETAVFIRDLLASCDGLQVEAPTETSVVARLDGSGPGRRLALRADIDALPIQEATGLEYASTVDGVMHACGHDGHAAMLLGVASWFASRRSEFSGRIRFVFQHAEELPPGGGAELVKSGVLEGVDAVIGCHLLSTLELGRIAALDGCCTAAGDTFSVRIHGRGGHAAFPHLVVDPIATAAQAVANVQHVVSRGTSPLESVVVSVTRIAGGTADNVIPSVVEFGGTVRTFTPAARERTRAAIRRTLEGVADAHGARCEFDYVLGYDPVTNDPGLAALVRDVAGERVIEMDPLMAGDDFSAYLRACPGCFFFVGAGGPDAFPHHHPQFAIDERALSVGLETLVRVALRFLDSTSVPVLARVR
jgi:amidohydrolase